MGNSASVTEEMQKVCEYAGKPDQESELFKALEALSAKIKSNPAKTINVFNNDGGLRVKITFSKPVFISYIELERICKYHFYENRS